MNFYIVYVVYAVHILRQYSLAKKTNTLKYALSLFIQVISL